MKKAIILSALILPFLLLSGNANASPVSSREIKIDFFYSTNCHFCAEEEKFLDNLEKKYPELEIQRWEITGDGNIELLKNFYQAHNVPAETQGRVPILFVQSRYFAGYNGETTTGKIIENYILRLLNKETPDDQQNSEEIYLPVLGKISPAKYSLPALAIILGLLDGFNVCSLGALVLILSLVLAFRSRFKIIFLGGLFLLSTAVIYGFLIFFWSKIFSFAGIYLRKLELLVGILSLVGGFYFLRNFFKFRKKTPACEIEGGWGKNIIARLRKETKKMFLTKNIFYIILGVLIFNAAITIIEFPCSAAIPLVFAGILAKASLPSAQYFLILALYMVFYLLDEILVFLLAVWTMKIWAPSSKFTVWSSLFGAVILLAFGIYYLCG